MTNMNSIGMAFTMRLKYLKRCEVNLNIQVAVVRTFEIVEEGEHAQNQMLI